MIAGIVNVDVSAMIGANIADEVSKDKFCEATIGKYTINFCNSVRFGALRVLVIVQCNFSETITDTALK